MKRTDGSGTAVTRAAVLLAGLAMSAVAACARERTHPGVRPAVMSLAAATDAADSVRRVLAQMRPDTGYETRPGLSDEQRLMLGTCPGRCRYGPRATIQPHRGAVYLTGVPPDSLVFIARLINVDSVGYGKFNLHARDTVYWAIGMRGRERVSIFYSSVPGVAPYYSDLEVEDHFRRPYEQATARWIWDDRDEMAWGTCDGGRCCRSSGLPSAAR